MKELFFENYVPMNSEEKNKIGEEFERVLRKIDITNIKNTPKTSSIKVQNDVWRVK